jgi:hypothetical protein
MVSGHHDYEVLREAQRQAEAAEAEASKRVPVNPYEPLHETHRQVAETLAQKPKERTDAEWAEIGLARDTAYIQNLRDKNLESAAEIAYRERALELEPLDRKIQRTKYEIARAEEAEWSRAYLESLKAAQPDLEKQAGDAPTRPAREHSDDARLRMAKLAEHIDQVQSSEKERESVQSRESSGRTR